MATKSQAGDPTIRIKEQPLLGDGVKAILTPGQYEGLRHSKRLQGGDWELTFFVPVAGFGIGALREWFHGALMGRLEEWHNGRKTWQGVVWEMDLVYKGMKRRRSVDKVWNAVKCVYTLADDTTQYETSYYTDASSIQEFLRREFIIYLDNVTEAEAIAGAQDFLLKSSEPKSELIGVGVEGEGLYVTAVGDVATLNNLFCTLTSPGTSGASAFISAIIAADSDLITAGRIATNSLSIEKEQRQPARVWDLIFRIASLGDGSNPYRVWVKDGRLHYQPYDTDYTYIWRDLTQGLQKRGGGKQLETWGAEPGILRDYTIPGGKPPVGSFLDDRRDTVLEEVQMWQGARSISVVNDEMEEEDLIQAMNNYQRMMSDYSFDPLHTPQRNDA